MKLLMDYKDRIRSQDSIMDCCCCFVQDVKIEEKLPVRKIGQSIEVPSDVPSINYVRK